MTKAGRPRAGETGGDRAEALKRSALDLMAREGFGNVTIKKIGREAGVTTAVIYYYFRDKEELLLAAIEYAIDEAFAYFESLQGDVEDPAQLLHEWLRMHVILSGTIFKMIKMVLDYKLSPAHSDDIEAALQRFYERERTVLTRCLEAGREAGLFAPVPAGEIAVLISTFLDGAMIRSGLLDDFALERTVALFERLLWDRLGLPEARRPSGGLAAGRAAAVAGPPQKK